MNETIDIDHLVTTITTGIYGDDRMSWSTIEAATTALSQLVAEVERLRGERPAVVAWLRHGRWVEKSVHMRHEYETPVPSAIHDAADTIERGEHRCEE